MCFTFKVPSFVSINIVRSINKDYSNYISNFQPSKKSQYKRLKTSNACYNYFYHPSNQKSTIIFKICHHLLYCSRLPLRNHKTQKQKINLLWIINVSTRKFKPLRKFIKRSFITINQQYFLLKLISFFLFNFNLGYSQPSSKRQKFTGSTQNIELPSYKCKL